MATRFILTVCIAGLIFPITTWAQSGTRVEIHYAPRENLESVDVQEIGRAELSIDMAAYVLSDPQIIEALTEAASLNSPSMDLFEGGLSKHCLRIPMSSRGSRGRAS